MGKVVKVYKVKDLETGLYRTAGGGWSSTGKTWNNLGHLKSSLTNEGYYNPSKKEAPGPEEVIIEIIVQETEGNTIPVRDLIMRERKMIELEKKYGGPFKDLVRRIEDQGLNDQFQWVLTAKGKWNRARQAIEGDFEELFKIIKSFKLKQHIDYKKASTYNEGGAVAFSKKSDAMKVRLAMQGKVQGIDIKNYIETNLDEDADSSV